MRSLHDPCILGKDLLIALMICVIYLIFLTQVYTFNKHFMQEQSQTNKAARQKQPYNHSSGSKSFLQRQHDLAKEQGLSVDSLELFRETHARSGEFISQAVADAHVSLNLIFSKLCTYTSPIHNLHKFLFVAQKMLELQSWPTSQGSQPLFEDDICKIVLDKRPGYSKGFGWGARSRSCKIPDRNFSTTSSHPTTVKQANVIIIKQQRLEIQENRRMIEEHRRFFEMQSKQMKEMMKKIEEMSRTQEDREWRSCCMYFLTLTLFILYYYHYVYLFFFFFVLVGVNLLSMVSAAFLF